MKKWKPSIKIGVSFGLTSAIITTLGLLIGLSASTNNKLIVIGGVLTIAIADSLSDALGIHLSVESDKTKSKKQIWKATFSAFITKITIALTFLIPILLYSLQTAIIISVIYGLVLLSLFSYYIANSRGDKPLSTILEHLVIAIIVIVLTRLIGKTISAYL
jgi:vacuolar iron transporter family protein